MDPSSLPGTEALAIWGAISGTIGTLIGALGLWVSYRGYIRDRAKLKCEAAFEYYVENGVPRPAYKIIARCVGRRPVSIDAIDYCYNPETLKGRLFRNYLWRKGKWRSRDGVAPRQTIHLTEGQKVDLPIWEARFTHLGNVRRVSVIDASGTAWKVHWPRSAKLAEALSHGEIERIAEENSRVSCKVIGYRIKNGFYISATWNPKPPNKSTFSSITLSFNSKGAYAKKMQDIRDTQIPALLKEEVESIG
jgi:hypothetical protein